MFKNSVIDCDSVLESFGVMYIYCKYAYNIHLFKSSVPGHQQSMMTGGLQDFRSTEQHALHVSLMETHCEQKRR